MNTTLPAVQKSILGKANYQQLLGDSTARDEFVGVVTEQIRLAHVGAVVSATTRSTIFASLACDRLKLPMAYLRPRPKVHGKQRRLEGDIPRGAKVLLLFDLPPEPDVVQDATAALRENSAVVAECLVLSDADSTDTFEPPAASSPRVLYDSEPWDSMATARRVSEALLNIGAVTIAPVGHPYEYVSGLLSPIYTDNRLLISHPDEWSVIVNGLVGTVCSRFPVDIEVVAGVVTSGLPHAAEVASRLHLPVVYTTEEQEARVEGWMAPSAGVLIIEDHVTTGGSVLAAAANIRKHGGQIKACLSIFAYRKDEISARFSEEGFAFATLCDLPILLDVGVEKGLFGAAERDAVLDWVADPPGWTQRRELERPPPVAST